LRFVSIVCESIISNMRDHTFPCDREVTISKVVTGRGSPWLGCRVRPPVNQTGSIWPNSSRVCRRYSLISILAFRSQTLRLPLRPTYSDQSESSSVDGIIEVLAVIPPDTECGAPGKSSSTLVRHFPAQENTVRVASVKRTLPRVQNNMGIPKKPVLFGGGNGPGNCPQDAENKN